jgi:lysyl endopeptidase
VKNPNATADENTVNDVFVYTYEVSPVYYTNDVILNITTGDYGLEVTFALTDRIGTEVAVGTTLTCNKNIQATLSTITVDEYYTFSIFDAYGDSI